MLERNRLPVACFLHPNAGEAHVAVDLAPADARDEPPLDPLFAPPAAEAYGAPPGAGGDAHPEIMVGAAFLGGVGLALLVKRLGS